MRAWHCNLSCKLLRFLPDKHMVRIIMKLAQNQNFIVITTSNKQCNLGCRRKGVPYGSVLAYIHFKLYTYCSILLPKSSKFFRHYCRRLEGHPPQVSTNRTGAKDLSFYYSRLLYYLDQMLTVMVLSQHRVLSFKIVRPRAPCGARCIGHDIRTWSVICSKAPHSHFGKGARPHLCIKE